MHLFNCVMKLFFFTHLLPSFRFNPSREREREKNKGRCDHVKRCENESEWEWERGWLMLSSIRYLSVYNNWLSSPHEFPFFVIPSMIYNIRDKDRLNAFDLSSICSIERISNHISIIPFIFYLKRLLWIGNHLSLFSIS